MIVGILNGRLFVTYVGRSRDQLSRFLQHLAEIAYDNNTHLFYQHASQCDEILFFPLFEQDGDDDEHKARLRAIIEGFWVMLLGSFCRSEAFNQYRCDYGLFDIGDDVVGGNKTPCLEKPEPPVGVEDDGHGQVLDESYRRAARWKRLQRWLLDMAVKSGKTEAIEREEAKLSAARASFNSIL